MKSLIAIAVVAGTLGLAACETDGYYDTSYYGAARGPYDTGYNGYRYNGGYSPRYYDGYYDNFYGPIYGGYWSGNVFFYQRRPNERFYRDDYRHFRRDSFQGSVRFRYEDHRRR
ncbi:MAG TPA: hypothetical protein VG942_11020 [Hyphomonadaceae bacterium]|nr:hypothetical protein [Hyphomonadaceae bacterium]